eukprot:jgi/Botrbrau1/21885/Bobra.0249s0014.1
MHTVVNQGKVTPDRGPAQKRERPAQRLKGRKRRNNNDDDEEEKRGGGGADLGLGAHDATTPGDAGGRPQRAAGRSPPAWPSSRWSSDFTPVRASAAAFFLCTTVPSRALLCTHTAPAPHQAIVPRFHPHEGRQPHHQLDGVHIVGNHHQLGLGGLHQHQLHDPRRPTHKDVRGGASERTKRCMRSASGGIRSMRTRKRCASSWATLSSGRYLSSSLKTVSARLRSTALVKRLSAGGTFSRWFKTLRCRWMRTYFGHFTQRCRNYAEHKRTTGTAAVELCIACRPLTKNVESSSF